MWYWKIMFDTTGKAVEVMAGTMAYATAELAREAGTRERLSHGWTMGDGYWTLVEEAKDG